MQNNLVPRFAVFIEGGGGGGGGEADETISVIKVCSSITLGLFRSLANVFSV